MDYHSSIDNKPIKNILNKLFFSIFVVVLTIIASSIGFHMIGWFFDSIFHNNYIDETILYFLPIFIPTAISTYFFKKNKKAIAILVIAGGLLYYLWIWFGILWAVGEGCFPLFYGLVKTC